MRAIKLRRDCEQPMDAAIGERSFTLEAHGEDDVTVDAVVAKAKAAIVVDKVDGVDIMTVDGFVDVVGRKLNFSFPGGRAHAGSKELLVGHAAALGRDKGCESFHYLKQSGVTQIAGVDDKKEFGILTAALGHVGCSPAAGDPRRFRKLH